MDPTGNQVVLGYADGVVRLFALETENDTKSTGSSMYKLTKALSARYLLIFKIFPDFLKYLCTYLPLESIFYIGPLPIPMHVFETVLTECVFLTTVSEKGI